jgi:UDP-glucose 4-epimerase
MNNWYLIYTKPQQEKVALDNLSRQIKVANRQSGDVASCHARVDKANVGLSWKATQTLEDICTSTWNFQKNL